MTWAANGRTASNSNDRGSAETRRRRKQWLLDEFGDGVQAQCGFDGCETMVTFETMQVDRFPIAGIDGGTYRRGNIRPACGPCNFADGLEIAARRREELKAAA
ncbi:hypothetical protein [Agromyces sp. NPDC058104]|uniref:hypothetical protein n=1 Tax=Agromyces sp. NPDC058104 TaxID=3346342 RepID=UPI0036DEC1EC